MQRFFSSAKKITLFNNELQKVNIDPVLKETDPDISFKVLLKDYMNLFNKYFSNRLSKTIERIIIGLIMSSKSYCPTKLFKKYMQTKSPETKRQFTKARNLYFRKIQQKKQEHIKNKLKSNKNDMNLPGGLSIAFWGRKIYLNVNPFTQILTN